MYSLLKNRKFWNSLYIMLVVLYAAILVMLAQNDISRIDRRYLEIDYDLSSDYAVTESLRIQKGKCIAELGENVSDDKIDECVSGSADEVISLENAIKARLEIEKKQALKKKILFWTVFVTFLLVVPPLFIYLFLLFLVYFIFNLKVRH